MMAACGSPGFVLLDANFAPIAFNSSALQILAYPVKPEQIEHPTAFLKDRVRSRLFLSNGNGGIAFVKEYRSGARRYQCRVFRCDCPTSTEGDSKIGILLERLSSLQNLLSETLEPFDLTPRELQTVTLLVEGLTSKEIATRMHISTNTVKAFLRLVMVKMNVSTRSGIVGKIVGPRP